MALLRVILFTLNHTAILNEIPTIPPAQEDPPIEIVTTTGLMYASLLISLLAAFVAMLGKQWLNRYLRNTGGSMIERCGDRQRKCDGLQKWPFHIFIESLPVMLQISLLLLACGLCRHMWSINTSIAFILIVLTALGVLFYTIIVIIGTSSYECPFQTPTSTVLRHFWKEIVPHIVITLHHLWETIILLYQMILQTLLWLLPTNKHPRPQGLSLPISQPTPQGLPTIQDPHITSPWMRPRDLLMLQNTNANDVRCVSWILWNITDPEALNISIRLASVIWWFEDGLNVEPPYSQIVSSLEACFDSTGKMYPGLRDRAYYSAQSILWIHVCAMCVPEGSTQKFPLPSIPHDTTSLDPDLKHLLDIYSGSDTPDILTQIYRHAPGLTPAYLQWSSNVVLHLSWAKQATLGLLNSFPGHNSDRGKDALPLNAILNHLLTSCIFLGMPLEEEILKIQDKSYVISYSLPSIQLTLFLLVITLIRSCLNSPKQWSQLSVPLTPTLSAGSSITC